jgi:hypothetical protein
MSGAAIAAISTLGAVGYLVVGWATTVLIAANTNHGNRADVIVFFVIPIWPFALVAGAVAWALSGCVPFVKRVTLRAVRRLNPQIEEWY